MSLLTIYEDNSLMTLAAASTVTSYLGNSGTNTYPFLFLVFNQSEISITVTSPTNIVYILTLGTDYTVSTLNPAGAPPTSGSITLVNASQAWLTGGNLTTGWTIQIARILPLAQTTSIRNQGDFYPEAIEAALDTLTMMIQQLNQAINTPALSSNIINNGDITVNAIGAGYVCTDPVTGIQYRIRVQNGVLGIETVV